MDEEHRLDDGPDAARDQAGDDLPLVRENGFGRDAVEQVVDACQHEADFGTGGDHAGVQHPQHLPREVASLPGIPDIGSSEPGIPVFAVGGERVPEQDDPHLCGRFGEDSPDNFAGQIRANGVREVFSGREHPAEEIPDIGREPGPAHLVEHQPVAGVFGGEIRPVGQSRRGVEADIIPACGEGFQRFVEPGDAVVQTGMFPGCRKRQEYHGSGSCGIEPFADRPECFQCARQGLSEQDFRQARIDHAEVRTSVQQPFVEVPRLLREQEILVAGVRHVVFRQLLPPVDVAALAVGDKTDDGSCAAVGGGEQAEKQPYEK